MSLLQSPTGTIDLLEWGNGDELFVMLHASATGPRSLTRLAELLRHAGRRIIAPAFVGYGRTQSSAQDVGNRLVTNRSIVGGVLRQQLACRRILFGHSMGGLIALLTALDEERRGSPFDAVILYEPIILGLLDLHRADHAEADAWDRAVIEHLAGLVRAGNPDAGVRHFIEAWNETSWDALPETARQQLIANADNLVRETAAVSSQKIDRSILESFTTPTLLLRGNQSPTLITLTGEMALNVLPSAHQTVLSGCGHMAPLLKPEPIAACIEGYLQTLDPQ